MSQASVNYANSAESANTAKGVNGDKVRLWSDGEGGNLSITAPDNTRWDIDAFNGNLRIFNDTKGHPGITITKSGQISDSGGNKLDNKSDKGHTHDDRYLASSRIKGTSKVYNISGNYVDIPYSDAGMNAGTNYAIIVQNANRAANPATVMTTTLATEPTPSGCRVYFDVSSVGNIQLNIFAIQI